MKQKRLSDVLGLRLSRQALRVLKERGIFAHSPVSLEHQHLAKRYVVRGLESGGAAGELGRYVTFTQEDGQPIEWLHPVEAIGVNGLHAVVVAPVLVRVEMLRKGRTYELLITQHRPGATNDGKRPPLETRLLFRGIHGRLDLDLSGKDKDKAGTVLPTFYSRAGEEVGIPKRFRQVGARDNRGGSLRRLFPLPLCQAAPEERGTGVRRGECHSLTWLNGRSE